MTTPVTINVVNNSNTVQNFFFFQQPATYSGGQQVFTNSLYTSALMPHNTSGAMLSFTPILQSYAGVQQQIAPPQVGQLSGQTAAMQPISVTPPTGGPPTGNTTTMTVSPSLGLSVPVSTEGPPPGSFRIVSPVFNSDLANYNAGLAVQSVSGSIILSNFVTAQPNSNLDCQPVIVFYVQVGNYVAGTVMNFTTSSLKAAVCDFTPGYTTFNVAYSSSGLWTATPQTLAILADGRRVLVGTGPTQTSQ